MATTVRELIELLRDYPGNSPVAIAKDPSGGELSPFEEITEEELAVEELRDSFDYDERDTAEGDRGGEIPVVVLWPSR